ncbi:Cobalt-zinc-cadmium resistance protein CzcC precursor [Rubripirellula amarantea]|uniref:Cobalt-zinc-cadmium resistance protein CzcC n=1 Tax=Rubripirellula amarantea TaxID=2527999 RepID=A0A5C5WLU3_9BACT|nr:TolC family protein [Rubripirellula amarantea]TWT50752.1 Cobalt-zinc-cadmium resistance protein CzcC precursor [Rubripirellula amarantea]
MKRLTIFTNGLLAISFAGCASVGLESLPMWPHASSDEILEAGPVVLEPETPPAVTPAPATAKLTAKTPSLQTVAYTFDVEGGEDGVVISAVAPPQESLAEKLAFAPVGFPELSSANNDALPNLAQLPVDGSSASPTYTLEALEQLALANNPAITAAAATSSKATGLWNQVGLRPNPTLGYFGQQLADRNTDQHGIFVEQEFVRGDKLKLNQAVLSHTTNAQRWEMETQRHRVLTDVRTRFFEAVAAQQQLDATRDFETIARRGVQVSEDRRKAEEGTLIEVLQSETLLSEITLAAKRYEATYAGAWNDLAAIAGIPDQVPARLIADLSTPQSAPDWNSTYDEIVAQSPELSVANALVCEKSALLKRQEVQMVPNLTGQLGAGYDNGTDSGMINVQVSAPIPVWNKNQGNISAAYADYTRAIENVKRIEQGIKSRLARAAQEFDASIETVRTYENEIIPQAKKSLELSEEAYQAGELDFLQVLIVRRSYYESTVRFIEAKGQLAQASAKVDGLLLTGGLDAPQDYTDGDGIRGASFGGQ